MPDLSNPETWVALLSLTLLEIVLGIDNVVFISILCGRLPEEKQATARNLGLGGAVVMRLALLSVIHVIVTKMTDPLFSAFGHEISLKGIVLIGGGAFLVAKSTLEVHKMVEGHGEDEKKGKAATMTGVVIQVLLLDLVFSLDSVITAVGMAKEIGVMMAAIVIAVGLMLLFSGPVSRFVNQHPTVKMLALSFLVLIGVALVADGLGFHIPKGYIYSAMAFSLIVEGLNLWVRTKTQGRASG